MMTHCTNCGQHLKENAKYCANCGAAIKILQQMNSYDVYLTISVNLVGDNNDFTNSFVYVPHLSKSIKVKIPNNISVGQKLRLKNLGNIMPDGSRGNLYLVLDKIDHYQVLQSPTPKGNQSSRQIVYEGKLHKCPNCGELLNSFAMTCPSCGYEIRDSLTSESVINFANRLMNVESENAKITLIRNFPIPNTKEDILEFIILAATNITREQSLNISSAWRAKFEQCYEKAKLTLSRNEDFQTIQEIYDKARRRIRREKLVKNVKNCAIKIFSNLRIIMKAIIKYVPNMLSKILNLVMSHVLSILGILSFMKAISIDQRGETELVMNCSVESYLFFHLL